MPTNKLDIAMLYVEDEKETREKLSEVFQNKVQTVYIAKNGTEALAIFKKYKIHLIISDYRMPKMDGIELCNAIKAISPTTNFTLLTAFNDSQLLMNAIEANVDKFLKKPVNAKKLFETLDDIYKKVKITFQLERTTVCLREAERMAHLAYWDVNIAKKQLHFSKEVYELFNVSTNLTYQDLAKSVLLSYKKRFLDIFTNKIYNDEVIDDIIVITRTNGKIIYLKITAKKWQSSICGKWHLIGIFQDITNFEIQRIALLKEAQSDPLLKISNKKMIANQLESLIKSSKRYGHPIGVIFFDIDNFKGINDKYGHLIADDVLMQLAELIQNNLRDSDYFGRWGGDEFIIINTHANPDSVIKLIEKLIQKIKKFNWVHNIKITISAGVSFYEADDTVKSIIDRADTRMLEAKRDGKDKYAI